MDPSTHSQPSPPAPTVGGMMGQNAAISAAPFLARTLVMIPALNEIEVIAETVREWSALGVHTVRVVDNGSTDGTSEAAIKAGASVMKEFRRGYGAACATGLSVIPHGVDWILFSSSDGSDRFQAAELAVWQQAVDEGNDLILGNRCLLPGAVATLKPWQRFGSWFAGLIMRWGWGVTFKDMGSRRAIRVSAYQRIGLQDRAFGWNVEMQVRSVEERLKFTEIPVPYFPRRAGVSKISGTWLGSLKASWGITSALLKLWMTKPLRAHRMTR